MPVEHQPEDHHEQGVEDAEELRGRTSPPDAGRPRRRPSTPANISREQRREEHGEHGRHVLHDPLLRTRRARRPRSPLPPRPRGAPARHTRSLMTPVGSRTSPVSAQRARRRPARAARSRSTHSPVKRTKSMRRPRRSHVAARVRAGDHEPQHDGQVQRRPAPRWPSSPPYGYRLTTPATSAHGTAVIRPCRRGRRRRRASQPARNGTTSRPTFRRTNGARRREARGEAGDLDRHGRRPANASASATSRPAPVGRPRRPSDELLPEPSAVLAGELPGHRVEAPRALHRDQERLRRPRGRRRPRAAIWSRRCASSSSTSRPSTAGPRPTKGRHSAISASSCSTIARAPTRRAAARRLPRRHPTPASPPPTDGGAGRAPPVPRR